MFLNPWYLQQQAAKQQQLEEQNLEQQQQQIADVDNQNNISLDSSSSSSPSSSHDNSGSGGVASHSPSPVPSVVSAGSCGSGNHNSNISLTSVNQQQVTQIQSSLKPGWTVHITPEGRLYYCNILADDNVHGVFVLYKVCSMLFFWSSLIFTWTQTNHGEKYLIYMTNWGICLLNFSILFETVIVIALFLDRQVHENLMTASWFCTMLFYNNAVFITVLFWSLLYDFSKPPSYANLYVHGLQGIFVAIDQFVTNRKWHFEKIWTCLPAPVVYVIFNVIYWTAGGEDPSGNAYVYPVLDWEDDPKGAAVTVVMGTAILPCIHIAFWFISLLRDWIHKKLFLTSRWDTSTGEVNNGFHISI